jgi:hypothetical protein
MESNDFIFIPAAQEKAFDDMIARVKEECNPTAATMVEETLKKVDINARVSQQVSEIQAELSKRAVKPSAQEQDSGQ